MKKVILIFGTLAELTKIVGFTEVVTDNIDLLVVWTYQHPDLVPKAVKDLSVEHILSNTLLVASREALKDCLQDQNPELVIVQGDTKSALDGAEVAGDLGIPLLHIEAGLRLSGIIEPEEKNRRRITELATFHVTTDRVSVRNLLNEGVDRKRIYSIPPLAEIYLGFLKEVIEESVVDKRFQPPYIVATIHRASNIDRQVECAYSLGMIVKSTSLKQMIVIKRPDTRWDYLYDQLAIHPSIKLVDSLSPSEFNHLICNSEVVITDSAGVQQECAILDIPHIVLRTESEFNDNSPHVEIQNVAEILEALKNVMSTPRSGCNYKSVKFWKKHVERFWDEVTKWLD